MSASSSSKNSTAAGGGGNIPSGGSQGSAKKTNVCLICGIYTNLSLNIFEPRNGPNIREVIYQKYNFKAERGANEDKFICYSCNNWLINWYSLQYPSESRSYESTSASNRSQSEHRNKHSKSGRSNSYTAPRSRQDKENLEQYDQVSSTVKTPEKDLQSRNSKPERPLRRILRETMKQNLFACERSNVLAKTSESNLILMLKKQGTSVIKEPISSVSSPTPTKQLRISNIGNAKIAVEEQISNTNDIILSFNSTISEIVNDVPSLKLLCHNDLNHKNSLLDKGNDFLIKRKLSRSLSISLIHSVPGSDQS